jgi:3-hydroxyacyl-[acyl-carrier-protein] dehydratase
MTTSEILSKLPYSKPFLFVDELVLVNENRVEGNYTFDEDLDFYKGHFKNNPITPGVIVTEVMAQIGVVCLGIFLMKDVVSQDTNFVLTATEVEFLKPIYPNQKVVVLSEKIYFRFGKLKCKVEMMFSDNNVTIARGTISGMIV